MKDGYRATFNRPRRGKYLSTRNKRMEGEREGLGLTIVEANKFLHPEWGSYETFSKSPLTRPRNKSYQVWSVNALSVAASVYREPEFLWPKEARKVSRDVDVYHLDRLTDALEASMFRGKYLDDMALIEEVVSPLNLRQAVAIHALYTKDLNQDEAAEELEVARQRVHEIENDALRRMRARVSKLKGEERIRMSGLLNQEEVVEDFKMNRRAEETRCTRDVERWRDAKKRIQEEKERRERDRLRDLRLAAMARVEARLRRAREEEEERYCLCGILLEDVTPHLMHGIDCPLRVRSGWIRLDGRGLLIPSDEKHFTPSLQVGQRVVVRDKSWEVSVISGEFAVAVCKESRRAIDLQRDGYRGWVAVAISPEPV